MTRPIRARKRATPPRLERERDRRPRDVAENDGDEGPIEIALVGDLTENESEVTRELLDVPPGGECLLYIDSPGGSPYSGMALMSLILLRGIRATGVVTGECSSSALWPFAACHRRLVTPHSVHLFHPMKWQSDEHVGLAEAAEWARHFGQLERDMDHVLADLFSMSREKMDTWMRPGRYVSGKEMADAKLAELISLNPLAPLASNGQKKVAT